MNERAFEKMISYEEATTANRQCRVNSEWASRKKSDVLNVNEAWSNYETGLAIANHTIIWISDSQSYNNLD